MHLSPDLIMGRTTGRESWSLMNGALRASAGLERRGVVGPHLGGRVDSTQTI